LVQPVKKFKKVKTVSTMKRLLLLVFLAVVTAQPFTSLSHSFVPDCPDVIGWKFFMQTSTEVNAIFV
jgi:hypothetical protein